MNREQLTVELTKIRNELNESQITTDKYKYKYRKIIMWGSLALATITFSVFVAGHFVENKFNSLEKITQEQKIALNDNTKLLKVAQENYKEVMENSSLVYVSKIELLEDLQRNYAETSMKTKLLILETIISESEKYGMNPLILYSIAYTESTFRHWLEHTETTVDIGSKKVKIKAVGLMGITWENHKEFLQELNIAETRGDLFDPVVNIKASAAILDYYMGLDKKAGAKTKTESALLRYFGGNFPAYVNKINNKITEFTIKSYFK